MELLGSLNAQGHPIFTIQVFGFSRQSIIQIPAMLDTGFTGFLDLPLKECLQTGLILFSTGTYTLANGAQNSTLLCLGTIVVPNMDIVGAISISSTNEALLGIGFLKKMNGRLEYDSPGGTVKIIYNTPPPPPAVQPSLLSSPGTPPVGATPAKKGGPAKSGKS